MGGLFSSKPTRVTPPSRNYYTQPRPASYAPPPPVYSFTEIQRPIPAPTRHRPATPQFLRASCITRNFTLLPQIMHGYTGHEITYTEMENFSRIQILFQRTGKPCMRLNSVKKVNNAYLEALYELKKLELRLTHGTLQEMELFHGTPSVNVDKIIKKNLNYRYYGKGVGCKFGNGISFTPFSYYASHYCNKNQISKQMFLCKVAKGNSHVGRPGLILPAEGYDTTQKENGHVAVKFDDDVYYPMYLLTFDKNEPPRIM